MTDSLPMTRLLLAGAVGLLAGGLADRAIRRLGLQRSFFWPIADHCEQCWLALPARRAVPLIGWLIVRRCPRCGEVLPRRRPLIEILLAALFVALCWLYLGDDRPWSFPFYPLPYTLPLRRALFVYHAFLIFLLVVATFIDLDLMLIPDSVTVTGMIAAVALGTFWTVELHPVPLFSPPLSQADLAPIPPITDWPGWLKIAGQASPATLESWRAAINSHWANHWNRWLGFFTSAAGLVIGGGVVWLVRAICSWAFGREAMGFGDVTLMAMVGAFLGWQAATMAFFASAIPGLVVAIVRVIGRQGWEMPLGPHLAIATVAILFAWRMVWRAAHPAFEESAFLAGFAGISVFLLAAIALVMAWARRLTSRLLRRRVAA